jgi:putative peptidoglycan lipid II flippase
VTQFFATPYGEGANTSVSAASTIMQAPVGIFGQSLALAIFPVLAQFVAQQRMDLYRDQISKTLRTAMFIAVPSAIFMAAMAEFLAHALYGYGQAAGEVEKLALIARLVQIYAIGVPFWIAQSILIRGFFSLHQTIKPVVMGTVATIIFIVLCLGVKYAPTGTTAERLLSLAWAANISVVVLTAALYLSLEKLVGKLDFKGIAVTTGKSVIAAGVGGALIYGGTHLFNINNKAMVFTFVLLAIAIGGGVFAGICRALKMPETEYLDRMFSKMDKLTSRFKKKPAA